MRLLVANVLFRRGRRLIVDELHHYVTVGHLLRLQLRLLLILVDLLIVRGRLLLHDVWAVAVFGHVGD